MLREYRERFTRHRHQRKPVVSDPGMYHGTCFKHVMWYMSESLTHGGGENFPSIPGACTTRNLMSLVRGLWSSSRWWSHRASTGLIIGYRCKPRISPAVWDTHINYCRSQFIVQPKGQALEQIPVHKIDPCGVVCLLPIEIGETNIDFMARLNIFSPVDIINFECWENVLEPTTTNISLTSNAVLCWSTKYF